MDELTSGREGRIADALTEKVLQAYSGIDNVRLRDIGKKDYLAYFGHYEVDVQNAVVRHLLEGELFPGHAEDLERKYHFVDEKLSLKPLDGTNREILWQRV
jgi:hypothetical protein